MKNRLPIEFLYQTIALVLSIIVVHSVYVTVIRPNADAILADQAKQQAENPDYVPERSIYVLVRDFEQESCFILMIWALALMGYKANESLQERRLLQQNLVSVAEGTSILPEDTRELARPIQALAERAQDLLLPRTLLTALHRFRSTKNIQDVSTAVRSVCEGETERLDSELSMIRYIAWAIPSIGFIGTVRGIGGALSKANQAVGGDISGVTQSLGVAFNSTFIALLISIVLMFVLHQLQLTQERLVLDTQNYLDRRLVRHLQVR